jgi:hypothetical protein
MSAEAEVAELLQDLIGSSRPDRDQMRTYLRLVRGGAHAPRLMARLPALAPPRVPCSGATPPASCRYGCSSRADAPPAPPAPQVREARLRDPEHVARYGLLLLQSSSGIPEEECEHASASAPTPERLPACLS